MACKFKYSVHDLIKLVEQRPILWDKNNENFYDVKRKENAWKEIYKFFEESFDSFEEERQVKIGMEITTKWRNIRDAFSRSLKRQSWQGGTRKYVYYKELMFLLKTIQKDQAESNASEIKCEAGELFKTDCGGDLEETTEKLISDVPTSSQPSSCRKSKSFNKKVKRELLRTLRESKSSVETDEDQMFFNSVLSSVKNLTEDEKIEFRMGVLGLIQQIKQRREFSN